MSIYFDTFSTPAGSFSVALDAHGGVLATAFGDVHALRGRVKQAPRAFVRDETSAARVRMQVREFFEGKRKVFDLPLAAGGSPFQHRVWDALRKIPFGETRSYGELAKSLKTAARAIGRANATNPICLIVPCHRVIGATGSLTGFAFGEDIKRRLLIHEGVALAEGNAGS